MADAEEYVDRAVGRIVEVLDEQHAVVNPELQARISEAGHRDSGLNIDPHHVTTALRRLSLSGIVVTQRSATRGGREIVTFRLGNVTRRETKIEKATQRKRVLMARYQGWSQGTKRHPHGTIGPAGEAGVRSAILAAGSLVPAAPGAGEVTALLGTSLRGPVDSAGYMVPILKGLPQSPVTVLFEVKNLRSWISHLKRGAIPVTYWADDDLIPLSLRSVSWPYPESGRSSDGVAELTAVLGKGHGFETVKPLRLFEKIIQLWCPSEGLILDPFAGSGTTGHAVLEMNEAPVTKTAAVTAALRVAVKTGIKSAAKLS